MRILVTGLVGQYPFGGVIWDYVQYLLGFRALGHEVWYVEDTGSWPYDLERHTLTEDSTRNVAMLGALMEQFGFGGRWVYRNGATGAFHGLPEKEARELVRTADLCANVSGAGHMIDYDWGRCHRMYLDGDPMFTQVALCDPEGKNPGAGELIRAHHSHFSFGLNIGGEGCLVPTGGLSWKKTVQPVSLEHWPVLPEPPAHGLTTVMSWASYAPCRWQGADYGQKDVEFARFLDLPSRVPQPFTLAMGKGLHQRRPTEMLREKGWTILEPEEVVPDARTYREFLSRSKGEWSVAKNGYVRSRSGWFSCRTACYLAAGRPAIVQETGWSRHLPAGEGLFAFEGEEDVARAAAAVDRDYPRQRAAARRLAEEHFEAGKVCRDLLAQAGLD